MRFLLSLIVSLVVGSVAAQTNFLVLNPLAENVLKGNYDPALYAPGAIVDHAVIAQAIQNGISANKLKQDIVKLATFKNRNTGADTVSHLTGIGAARRWVYSEFQGYAQQNNRLIPSYFQFDQQICGQPQHRNIMCVLPGTDTADKSVIIIEGHIDSRCKGLCDTACVAEGIEDNATGTALVMELARVMSAHTYKNTLVFMVVIGEEQGLYGAGAFAMYCKNNGIKVKAVMNNDVIGGIICGKTSSAPSCPGENNIDSLQVRMFSQGVSQSEHKNLARFIKLEYQEELKPYVSVPMQLTIMTAEDRTGRGGDHQPFRQNGFRAMRFTSANEHGDASNASGYTDRQHTSGDILGVDTDNNTEVDSFFVDFNYLARNAAINGNAAAMAAIGPKLPTFTMTHNNGYMKIEVTSASDFPQYRIGVRTGTNTEFDTLRTITSSRVDSLPVTAGKIYLASVASVDENGVESLFASEQRVTTPTGIADVNKQSDIELLPNKPNPFDEATAIGFIIPERLVNRSAWVSILDIQGREIQRLPVKLQLGMNEVIYEHGYNTSGTYLYQLVIDGKLIATRQMIFTAN